MLHHGRSKGLRGGCLALDHLRHGARQHGAAVPVQNVTNIHCGKEAWRTRAATRAQPLADGSFGSVQRMSEQRNRLRMPRMGRRNWRLRGSGCQWTAAARRAATHGTDAALQRVRCERATLQYQHETASGRCEMCCSHIGRSNSWLSATATRATAERERWAAWARGRSASWQSHCWLEMGKDTAEG